jgi:hypothetical protein
MKKRKWQWKIYLSNNVIMKKICVNN